MLLVLYGPYEVDSGQRIPTAAEAAIYNGWSRTSWSVGLGYIILACCMGYGGEGNILLFIIFNSLQKKLIVYVLERQCRGFLDVSFYN